MSTSIQEGPALGRTDRWGGALVGIGALSIVVAIVLYLTSGAVAPPGASAERIAQGLTDGSAQVALMAYLSVPANLALFLGAVLLASRPVTGTGAVLERVAWSTVAVSSLLVLQFDLLLPHAILPMAEAFHEAPLVFEALFRSSDYVHSVGLLVTYTAFLALFGVEAARGHPTVARPLTWAALVAWTLGLVVATGLVLQRPLVAIAPAVLVGWLLVSVLGLRTAWSAGSDSPGPRRARPRGEER